MSSSAELDFWLAYCERRGGAFEDGGDSILVLLPEELQREHGLGEEVVVTADPEVAREDGAVLLLRGHPAVEGAAATVLGAGDTGVWQVGWPPGRPPDHLRLLEEARQRFPVDHGRLDLEGRIEPIQQPVLRVGALVTYTVGDRFQEQLELCLDALSGLPVADDLGRRLMALPGGGAPVWVGGSSRGPCGERGPGSRGRGGRGSGSGPAARAGQPAGGRPPGGGGAGHRLLQRDPRLLAAAPGGGSTGSPPGV